MVEATALSQVYPQMVQNSYLSKAMSDRGALGLLTPNYGLQGGAASVASLHNSTPSVRVGDGGQKQIPTNFLSNNSGAYQSAMVANQQAVARQGGGGTALVPAEIAAQAALGGALLLACLLNWPLIG